MLHVLLLTGSCATHIIQKVELAVDISKHFGFFLSIFDFLQLVSTSKAGLASVAASLTPLSEVFPK